MVYSKAEGKFTSGYRDIIHSITLPNLKSKFADFQNVSVVARHKGFDDGVIDSVQIKLPGHKFILTPGDSIATSKLEYFPGNSSKPIDFDESNIFQGSNAHKVQAIRLLHLVLKEKPNDYLERGVGHLFNELIMSVHTRKAEESPAWLDYLINLKSAGVVESFDVDPEQILLERGGSRLVNWVKIKPTPLGHGTVKTAMGFTKEDKLISGHYYLEVKDPLEYARFNAHKLINAPLPVGRVKRAWHATQLKIDEKLYSLGILSAFEDERNCSQIYLQAIKTRLQKLKNSGKINERR